VMIGLGAFQGVLHTPAITWSPDGDLYLPVIRGSWPYAGTVIKSEDSQPVAKIKFGSALTHGPPGMRLIQHTPKGVVIGCTRLIIRVGEEQPYKVLSAWSSPSALGVDENGAILWTDKQSGKVWRIE